MLPKQTSKHGPAQRSLASFFSLPSGSPINGTITTPAAPQVIEEIKLIQNIYEISRHTGIHLSFVNGKQPTMTGVNSRWHSTTIKRFCRNEQFGKKKGGLVTYKCCIIYKPATMTAWCCVERMVWEKKKGYYAGTLLSHAKKPSTSIMVKKIPNRMLSLMQANLHKFKDT